MEEGERRERGGGGRCVQETCVEGCSRGGGGETNSGGEGEVWDEEGLLGL